MRLDLTSAVALAATLSLSPATASPLHWPEEGEALAFHCAAVMQAYGHAYEVAADLSGQRALPMSALPAPFMQLAGGNARLADIAAQAEAYHPHAESLARTSFYPSLMGDGTPYLADDGRDLMVAVRTCVTQFGL